MVDWEVFIRRRCSGQATYCATSQLPPWLLHIFIVWSVLQLTINISRLRTFTLIVQISKRKAIARENCEIFDNTPQFLKILFVTDLKKIENYDDLYFIDNSRLVLVFFFNSLLGVCTLYKCSSHVNNITWILRKTSHKTKVRLSKLSLNSYQPVTIPRCILIAEYSDSLRFVPLLAREH